jgi:hypothetical protein
MIHVDDFSIYFFISTRDKEGEEEEEEEENDIELFHVFNNGCVKH